MADKPVAVKPPYQARSRRTEQAIATALGALMREKSFTDITVADIATAAGVSVGGFYARFESKEALLAMVELRLVDEFKAVAEARLDAAALEGKGVEAVAHAYVEMLVTHFRSHRTEILEILRFSRPNSETEQRLKAFNRSVHDLMRSLLLERRREIHGHDALRTINLGLFFASASCREAVLTRNLEVYPVELSDAELIDEISAAFASYLTRAE